MNNDPVQIAKQLKKNKEEHEQEQARIWQELGPIFLEARKQAGLTCLQVGEMLDCSHVTVWRVETGDGHGQCSIELLGRIAAVLDTVNIREGINDKEE